MTVSMRRPASLSQSRLTRRSALRVVAAFPEAGTATRFEAIAAAQVAMPFERMLPWLTKAKIISRLT